MASQAGKKARNRLGLKLNISSDTLSGSGGKMDLLSKQLSDLNLDEDQKSKLNAFIEAKKTLGEMKKEDFEKLEELGFGNSGVVNKVLHIPSGLLMAQKIIRVDLKPAVRNQILRELKVLQDCNSPYIVGYYGSFSADADIYLLMEVMNCGSLDKIVRLAKRIPENILGKVSYSVLEGLSYLREKHKVIHRDVKPSNILLNTGGDVKICDFGVSGQLIDSMANSFVGTRSYMAPERLQGVNYGVRCDIWSLGLLLVELSIGKFPIPAPTQEEVDRIMEEPLPNYDAPFNFAEEPESQEMAIFELLDYIVNETPPSLKGPHFSEPFTDFTSKCLVRDPAERADLVELLEHPFILMHSKQNVAGWIKKVMRLPV